MTLRDKTFTGENLMVDYIAETHARIGAFWRFPVTQRDYLYYGTEVTDETACLHTIP